MLSEPYCLEGGCSSFTYKSVASAGRHCVLLHFLKSAGGISTCHVHGLHKMNTVGCHHTQAHTYAQKNAHSYFLLYLSLSLSHSLSLSLPLSLSLSLIHTHIHTYIHTLHTHIDCYMVAGGLLKREAGGPHTIWSDADGRCVCVCVSCMRVWYALCTCTFGALYVCVWYASCTCTFGALSVYVCVCVCMCVRRVGYAALNSTL